MANVNVNLEFTPNPNALKYSVNRRLLERGLFTFGSTQDAEKYSPLAAKLFTVKGVKTVTIGKDYVTVLKDDEYDWDAVHNDVSGAIETFLKENKSVLSEAGEKQLADKQSQGPSEKDQEIEKRILKVIDEQIRPRLEMDGGDIQMEKYEDGIVYVQLQGACRGCPGAKMTLKMGVERLICEQIPEVQEVIAL